MFMTLFYSMGLISTVALGIPIILLLVFRLAWYRTFPALFLYYLIIFSYNLIAIDAINASVTLKQYHGIINNLLDGPLILFFLTYFTHTAAFRKRLTWGIVVFIVFEAAILSIYGFTGRASVIISGIGILITLVISAMYFIRQVKLTVVHQKAAGKALIVASILFAYIGYGYVY